MVQVRSPSAVAAAGWVDGAFASVFSDMARSFRLGVQMSHCLELTIPTRPINAINMPPAGGGNNRRKV